MWRKMLRQYVSTDCNSKVEQNARSKYCNALRNQKQQVNWGRRPEFEVSLRQRWDTILPSVCSWVDWTQLHTGEHLWAPIKWPGNSSSCGLGREAGSTKGEKSSVYLFLFSTQSSVCWRGNNTKWNEGLSNWDPGLGELLHGPKDSTWVLLCVVFISLSSHLIAMQRYKGSKLVANPYKWNPSTGPE